MKSNLTFTLQVTTGFITNSSSMICWFDRALLDHPDVKAFMAAYGIEGGMVGKDLWHRGACTSILMTPEQRKEAQHRLRVDGYSDYAPDLGEDDDKIIVIYGDEYTNIASEFSEVLCRAMGAQSHYDAGISSIEFN